MKQPRRKNHDAKQELIMEAARRIVEKKGIEHLSIRALAAKLECSVGTIYNYFVDLNSLILRLNAQTISLLSLALKQGTEKPASATPHALVDAYFDFVAAHHNLWHTVFTHYPPSKKQLPKWYTEIIEEIVGFAQTALGQNRNITIGLWAALHGLTLLDQQQKLKAVSSGETPRQIAHALVAAALRQAKP